MQSSLRSKNLDDDSRELCLLENISIENNKTGVTIPFLSLTVINTTEFREKLRTRPTYAGHDSPGSGLPSATDRELSVQERTGA